MIAILFIIISCLILTYAAWQYEIAPGLGKHQKTGANMTPILLLLAVGLIARIICAVAYKGHETDMACFMGWAQNIFENGVGSFYKGTGFTDYPPGYMYILYVVGALRQLFNAQGTAYYLLVKLPAIIADLVSGYFIYKIASKKLSPGVSVMLAALYVFNPAVITDSSLWGQVDSVYTLCLALMVWLIAEKRMEISYFVFAMCILIKPQAFIYTPLIIYGIIENYVYPELKKKELVKTIGFGLGAIAYMVLLSLPFGITEVFNQYTKALSEYPYFTINALNLWGMLGLNWDKLNAAGTVIGYIILALVVAASAVVFFRSKNKSKYYFTAALLAFFTFMLSTKMHERYGFPVMIFLLLAFIDSRSLRNYAMYVLVAMSQFYNIAWVLFLYETDTSKYAFYSGVNIASAVSMLVLAYVIYAAYKNYVVNDINMVTPETAAKAAKSAKRAGAHTASKSSGAAKKPVRAPRFMRTRELEKLTKIDAAVIAAIMVVYSAVALYSLGNMSAPETGADIAKSAVTFDLNENKALTRVRIFVGDTPVTEDNPLILSYRAADSEEYAGAELIKNAPANGWIERSAAVTARYVTVSAGGASGAGINEISVYGADGLEAPTNTGTGFVGALCDEAEMPSPSNGVELAPAAVERFGSDTDITSMKFFLGVRELNDADRPLLVTAVNGAGDIVLSKRVTSGSVFCWNDFNLGVRAERVILSGDTSDMLCINETAFLSGPDNVSPASGTDAITDEQELVPERKTFMNSTYFDEIYHARTAYEFIHHLPVYEWTHPPLGKIFISLGIMAFGMNPFGWRIAGTLFGILMIPIIYIFARQLLKKRWLAAVTCILFTFDFMHFAQTRIATIDVYVTFFIILMYMFMFRYCMMSFNDTPLKKTLAPLALCGVSMGLGIASKWTGIYAGAGLAIIFFYTLYLRYREYSYALSRPGGETDGIKHRDVIDSFWHNIGVTIGWCVIFFIIVPAIIYGLSYIPYLLVPNSQGLKTIIDNQRSMLTYHSSTVLGSTHPYSSRWYEWIIMKRPIWYYSGTISDNVKEGISAFGNPLVWWLGIPAFFWMIYNAFAKKDKTCLFLIIAYLAQLVPWIPIERVTFIYHYFPCVPFIVLMLGYSIKLLYDDAKNKKAVMYGAFVYAGLVIVLFIMFYPVLSGQPCSVWYANHFLKWFDSWVLL